MTTPHRLARIAAWPRLSRFYGMSPAEIAATPYVVLKVYIDAMPALQAEEQLYALQVADYPHVGEIPRAETFNRLRLIADGHTPIDPEVQKVDVSTEQGQIALAGLGIKVVTD